ncbi:MAG: arginase family protein [Vicinamibacterales bacterium]|nr:arginase family protein [Vicinamibacterales bacterium]
MRPGDCACCGHPRARGAELYREAHMLMELVADTGRLRALDLVEVNPVLDTHNMTAQLGVELALSAFGQQIL